MLLWPAIQRLPSMEGKMSEKNKIEFNPSLVWMRTHLYFFPRQIEYFDIEILDKKEPLRFIKWKDQKKTKEQVVFGFWTGQALKSFRYLDTEGHKVFSGLRPKFGKVKIKIRGEKGCRKFANYDEFLSKILEE